MRHEPNIARQHAVTGPVRRGAGRHRVGRPWLSLLSAVLQLAGGKAELLRHTERAWASVTFAGSRHVISLRFSGLDALEAGDAFVDALGEHEFTLSGQIVADARITAVEQTALPVPVMTVEAELLLVEDA